MTKKLLMPFIFAFALTAASAQSAYTLHTIADGETLSAIAKDFHTTVGDIMRLNGMNTNSKLEVGAKIKIPASATTTKPATKPATTETASTVKTPALTHVVQTGESLYRIAHTYKVPVEKIITWNSLANADNIKVGQTLIVSDGIAPTPTKTRTEQAVTKPQETVQQPVTKPQEQVKQVVEEKIKEPVKTETQTTTAPPVNTTQQTNNTAQQTTYSNTVVNSPKEGFFTTLYGKEVEGRTEQTKGGMAMTFKSASGWADKKYYVLMNDAPPGSIVKVTYGSNTLYAKVLWSLSNMKENEGLDFRISTAAASALGITDTKFSVNIQYFQ